MFTVVFWASLALAGWLGYVIGWGRAMHKRYDAQVRAYEQGFGDSVRGHHADPSELFPN